MTSALTVASYIKDRVQIPSYDTKKLQKLIYFSQAWSLAWTGKPLVGEDFEAWPDGPVVRSVFREQKHGSIAPYSGDALTDDELAIIDSVIEYYGSKTYGELIDLSHDHTPWAQAREGLAADAPSRRVVSTKSIREFYTRSALVGADQPARLMKPRVASDRRARLVGTQVRTDWRKGLSLLADR